MGEHRDPGKLVAIETWLNYKNRPVSQMRVLLAACRELALDYDTLQRRYMVLSIKRTIF